MKRAIVTGIAILALVLFASQNVFTYGSARTANAGAFVTIPFTDHWCGLETRGNPGAFCDSD